jgi:carboxyl-terminal processing protease
MEVSHNLPPRRGGSLAVVLLAGMICGAAVDRFGTTRTLVSHPLSLNFELIAEAWNAVDQAYVDHTAVNPGLLTYGAISGMVSALGDTGHSRFLSPEQVKTLKRLEQNTLDGIGAEVQIKDGHVVIVAPIHGSPAQKAGLQPGDIILKVAGYSVAGASLDHVLEQILGPPGTQVTLTILNPPSGHTRDVTITRARITLHQVTWRKLPGTSLAHLHIANFNSGVSEDLSKALAEMKQEGDVRGLILDLRNNPGGLLRDAVAGTSQFLTGGNVLLVKNAKGEIKPVPVRTGGIATNIPMTVLVNGGTASASEIVAGALQDAKRATVIGEQTFGTGTVLSQFGLSDGSALLLAIEEWLTPDGHTIWHKGIMPDIAIGLPAGADPLFPESEDTLSAARLRDSQDKQLLRSIQLLGW